MRVSGGLEEDGIVVGNAYDKYGSGNPVVKRIMAGFHNSLEELVAIANPRTIHEIGCGEGYWVANWARQGFEARGSDFSDTVIELARANAAEQKLAADLFTTRSIYDITPERDGAGLLVCCEVLEHLENPEQGLEALSRTIEQHLILSVPREPLWRILNMARGKYITSGGNTPGHIQHWSRRGFLRLVSKYFDIVEVRSPHPWTMVLCRPRRDQAER